MHILQFYRAWVCSANPNLRGNNSVGTEDEKPNLKCVRCAVCWLRGVGDPERLRFAAGALLLRVERGFEFARIGHQSGDGADIHDRCYVRAFDSECQANASVLWLHCVRESRPVVVDAYI